MCRLCSIRFEKTWDTMLIAQIEKAMTDNFGCEIVDYELPEL
jgi:hypothetical protein